MPCVYNYIPVIDHIVNQLYYKCAAIRSEGSYETLQFAPREPLSTASGFYAQTFQLYGWGKFCHFFILE